LPIQDLFRLDGRAAVVTGAGRGIGAAVAEGLAEAGADVVLAARSEEQLRAVSERVEAAGRRAAVVAADLRDLDALRGLVGVARERFGRLDVVVNNVGGTMPRPLLETDEDFFAEALHFNTTTAFALSRAATPLLLEHDGAAIVNIASAMGRLVERGFVAYGTAKAALIHMTRLVARDLAPRIRVNAIAVGSVATSALELVLRNEALRERMEQATPLKRIGEAREVAAAVVYLASPAAAYMTGKVLELDGGTEAPSLGLGLPDLGPGAGGEAPGRGGEPRRER